MWVNLWTTYISLGAGSRTARAIGSDAVCSVFCDGCNTLIIVDRNVIWVVLPFVDQTSSWVVAPSVLHSLPAIFPVINDVGDAVTNHSSAFSVVAVVPLSPPFNDAPSLTEWGTAVREAVNAQLESGLSHLSPRPYETPPRSPLRSSSLRFSTFFPSRLSPRR